MTSVNKKYSVFWDISPSGLLKADRRFGKTFRLLKRRRMGQARNQNEADSMYCSALKIEARSFSTSDVNRLYL
jgi:hypothetical protein